MPTNDLPNMVFDALNRHIPPGSGWIPITVAAVLGLFGFVFMVKGARLAPILAAICFGLFGAAGGSPVAGLLSTPLWPTVGACAVVGLVLGVLLFRVWLAALVGGCLIVAGLGVYTGQMLREPLNAYLASGLDRDQQLVTLPEAAASAVPSTAWHAELGGLWAYLATNVPNFRPSVYAIVLSAGLAGLIFGLLLPKIARAFWAASFGTWLLLVAVYGAVELYWPAAAQWLGQWGLLVAGVLWGISLLYNLLDMQAFGLKKPAPAEAKAGITA